MRAAWRALDGRANVDRRIATGSRVAIRSRRRDQVATSRYVAFPTELRVYETLEEQSFHKLCSARGGFARGFLGDSSSWDLVGRVLSARIACGAGETPGYRQFSALVVGGTDTSRRTGPQLVLFPVPHFRELRSESLKVTERQLDLPSVAARLRGRLVRESRRLPNRLLVPGRTVAEQGLRHLQQCNFLSLYTSGYAPGYVVQVYGFS
ncbi:hypothetical protein Taro_023919 [Colocasia esculenta]|uniref:Uncharacterized protein n=1 Tax=Colocasia esculenta TaxID=4460 RepID=A0A843VC68_COLES|nr:hypothetical protein [Colocasia esculenta]